MNKARAIIHIIAGLAYVLIAFLVMKYQSFGTIELGSAWSYGLGVLLIAYGAFRIYRGFKDYQSLKQQ